MIGQPFAAEAVPLADVFILATLVFLVITGAVRLPYWSWPLFAALAAMMAWSSFPLGTGATLVRAVSLVAVASWAYRHWDLRSFAIGILPVFALQLIDMAVLDPVMWEEGRDIGWTRYATILSTGSFALALSFPRRLVQAAPVWLVSVLLMASAGSRAPLGAMAAVGVAGRSWRHLILFVLAAGAFYVVQIGIPDLLPTTGAIAVTSVARANSAVAGPDAISRAADGVDPNVVTSAGVKTRVSDIPSDFRVRVATSQLYPYAATDPVWAAGGVCGAAKSVYGYEYVCGPGSLSLFGDGALGYMKANPWPRPHSIYGILLHEWGLLALVPLAIVAWAVFRKRLWIGTVAGIGALGILDDTLLSQPEGHYMLAILLLVSAGSMAFRRNNRLEEVRSW